MKTITQESPRHFSDWISPTVNGYKAACCDCGMVHDFQFTVILKGGGRMDARKGTVKFRVRRNEKETAKERLRKRRLSD